jgi:hypothetical protein
LPNQSVFTSDAPDSPAPAGDVVRLRDLVGGDELLPLEAVLGILAGIAAALPADGASPGTVTPGNAAIHADGRVVLAPFVGSASEAYVAPEQRGGGHPAPSADEYALGMIAYELLTGSPRTSDVDGSGIVTIADIDVGPAHVLRPELPLVVNAVIKRATLREPGSRYGSPAAFVDALARATRGEVEPVQGPALVAPPPVSRPELRRRGTALGTVAARLGMAGGVVGLLVGVTWLSGALGGVWAALADRRGPGHTLDLAGDTTRVAAPAAARAIPGPTPIRLPGLGDSAGRTGPAVAAGFVRVAATGGTPVVLVDGRAVGRAPTIVRAAPGVRSITVRDSARGFVSERSVLVLSGDTVEATFRVLP